MAGAILTKRELYVDVEVKDEQIEEIFLYRVDFYRDYTFRTEEYLYKTEEPKALETSEAEENSGMTEDTPLPPEPLELFKKQWELLCMEEVPTEVYATDAMHVMKYVFEELKSRNPEFRPEPCVPAGREFIHDCVSMGRVISMSVFDEEQYLSAGIRRRIKERYHVYVDKIKEERQNHIFICQRTTENMEVLLLYITDSDYSIKKQLMFNRGMKGETLATRLKEILALYPEADITIDNVTQKMHRLFYDIGKFITPEDNFILFSMESMMVALGKTLEVKDMVKTYLLYIRNMEEMRLGMFVPDRVFSVHSFYLPVQLSDEAAWKKHFKNNSIWKQDSKECYHISSDDGMLKGKYIVRAGKEQFILKVHKISLQRYMKKYAVLRLDLENYCYPGEEDKKRINALGACLFAGNGEPADSMELKFKEEKQAYALTAIPMEGNENQLWLNGLLTLGTKKKKQGKRTLALTAMKEHMYCVESTEIPEEEQIIQNVIIRDGVFRKIEDTIARVLKPEQSDRPSGSLLKHQKRAVLELFEMYRYMVASFGETYEATQNERKKNIFITTESSLGTIEVTTRLDRKFKLFF